MVYRAILYIAEYAKKSNILTDYQSIDKWITTQLIKHDLPDRDKLLKDAKKTHNEKIIRIDISKDIYAIVNTIPECAICLVTRDENNENSKWINMICCKNEIHNECYDSLLNSTCSICPYCHTSLPNHDNIPPFGTMIIRRDKRQVIFKNNPTKLLYIEYKMDESDKYSADHRGAFIPDTNEGNIIMDRLIHAFIIGCVFSIGRSITRGIDNVIVWNGIHHKTSLTGIYGFPDDTYLNRVSEELDKLNIKAPFRGSLTQSRRKVIDYR